MSIKVLTSGALTTVQDGGRIGFMQYGIGRAGAMDMAAYRAANYLVGNDDGEAVLEATFMGPSLEFGTDAVIALTGADMGAMLDGKKVPLYEQIAISAGQKLVMAYSAVGCRGYLAVAGGIDVPKVMGSRATDLKCRIGGLNGRALKRDDILPIGIPSHSKEEIMERMTVKATYADDVVVRVVEGPQADSFTAKGKETFYSQEYTLTPESDRMGMRFAGTPVETVKGSDIVSDGITFGSVQIPSGGCPIILMADHQTTGGYAKLATVASADLPLLAQLKPGAKVRFKRISIEEAEELAIR